MAKQVANPRLIDVFGVDFSQDDVDFAIPRLHADIPLYVDPFLLWISAKPAYRELHDDIVSFFRVISDYVREGQVEPAAELLAGCREPLAMGLGYATNSRSGSNIGPTLIASILQSIDNIPQLRDGRMRHVEELQLVVPKFAEDRASDTASSVIKRFFIQYTADQAALHKIPVLKTRLGQVFDPSLRRWIPAPEVGLPYNPVDGSPILLVPLDMLRRLPWINYGDYYRSSFSARIADTNKRDKRVAKAAVLAFNSRNYVEVERYVSGREKLGGQCHPDPLFASLTPGTLRTKFRELRDLPIGSTDGADRRYEDLAFELLSSLLYPALEFAESRVRTVSGVHIRDLIFYNDGKTEFWRDVRDRYDARQPVFEMKNTRALESEHVNQLYRYLDDEFGRFGLLVTRNPAPSSVVKNLVDLHSSKRVTILTLDDRDLELMMSTANSSRDPSDVVKKKFVEFTRLLPK
jgi:hypothetical protein